MNIFYNLGPDGRQSKPLFTIESVGLKLLETASTIAYYRQPFSDNLRSKSFYYSYTYPRHTKYIVGIYPTQNLIRTKLLILFAVGPAYLISKIL